MGRTSDAREKIVESAMELFHARSVSDVGVQEICEHAGVKKGSFYHFFQSKQDLVVAVLDAQWQWGKTVWDTAFSPEIPPLDRFQALSNTMSDMANETHLTYGVCKGCPMGNIIAEMGTQDDVVRQKADAIFDEIIDYIKTALDEAVASGELPEINTKEVAQAFWAYLEGTFLMAKSKQDPAYMAQLMQTGIAFLDSFRKQTA